MQFGNTQKQRLRKVLDILIKEFETGERKNAA